MLHPAWLDRMTTYGRAGRRAAVVVGLGALLLTSCHDPKSDRPGAVLVSGDTHGWIVPCGCASNQSGGLPRRATLIDRARQDAPALVVDAGGAAAGTSPYDRVRFEAILRGEKLLDTVAHNIGAAEAALGPDFLREVSARTGVPLVSANVCDLSGKPIAQPLVITSLGSTRVALIGVLGEEFASAEIKVLPPRAAVLDVLRRHADRYDAAIVLAYLSRGPLEELAGALPEAHIVVGGPTGQPVLPMRVGPTLLASATNKGKFVARFDGRGGEWTGSVCELTDEYADDPRQVANLQKYYEELGARDFAAHETGFVDPLLADRAGYRTAGNARCRECHAESARIWEGSKHAHAWQSLEAKGAEVDPECQRCHTTAYGMPGGFLSRRQSPGLVQVGCESCHGPSLAHADDPRVPTPRAGVAADGCVACHDRENSPHFEFASYWHRIRHDADTETPQHKSTNEASP